MEKTHSITRKPLHPKANPVEIYGS